MPSKIGRATEHQMSIAVMRLAASKPNGYVSLNELRTEVYHYIELTKGDMEHSQTRPGERLWEQLLRNIQSHHTNPDNFIRLGYLKHVKGGGYAITGKGREVLNGLDLK